MEPIMIAGRVRPFLVGLMLCQLRRVQKLRAIPRFRSRPGETIGR